MVQANHGDIAGDPLSWEVWWRAAAHNCIEDQSKTGKENNKKTSGAAKGRSGKATWNKRAYIQP